MAGLHGFCTLDIYFFVRALSPNKLQRHAKMILTKCAACAAPLAHDAPRCVRCKTRYLEF